MIGVRITKRNIKNLRYADTTLMTQNEEELKSLLMKVKEESEKAGLNSTFRKTKTMASSPITSWRIDGEERKLANFIFLGFKITADSDCSHEIKRCLLLGRQAMTNLDSLLKSTDITFPVVMCGSESWTLKKAEHQRIDAFKLCCWRRLQSLLDCKEIKPRNLKEINPEYSLEGLMLKVKLQYFGHLM